MNLADLKILMKYRMKVNKNLRKIYIYNKKSQEEVNLWKKNMIRLTASRECQNLNWKK